MDLLDKYLAAVAAQLPAEQREDIVDELRDLILSRFEAREEELGRVLTDDEKEAILREVGHPLVVAARYRKGPDSLIGPQLFPYWLFAAKAGLLILAVVAGIGMLVDFAGGEANFGQDISHAFHGFFANALTLLGALTLAGAIMEHYDIRPKWLTQWRVSELGAFNLSDPSAWGEAVGGTDKAKQTWAPSLKKRRWPGFDYLFSIIVTGLFVAWWIGAIHFPLADVIVFRGDDATVTGAPIWAALFIPILIYALASMAVDLASLARPDAPRLRAALLIPLSVAGLWLTWTIWQAGHWFTLTMDGQSARIEGGVQFLSTEALRRLSEGGNADLTIWATNLSGIGSWVLVVIGVSCLWSIAANLWKLARPASA